MRDRIPADPGRVKMTRSDGTFEYVTLERADNPTQEGTPLNKALLDYAVAACGVTAGTATALTLDDAFGGFTLVDGAKVNFRLHVASGVNPTLNVNGTGAKALVDATNMALSTNLPAGTWIDARYSAPLDAYVLTGNSKMRWVNQLTANATAISVTIPDGYTTYRLYAGLRSNSGYTTGVTITTNAGMKIMALGANLEDTDAPSFVREYEATARPGIYGGDYYNLVDMLIIRGAYNGISGMVNSGYGFGAFASSATTTKINTITLAGFSMKAGSTVVLEGIA